MSIKLYLPRYLTHNIMKGNPVFEVKGETVGECLVNFVNLNPRMKEVIFLSGSGKAIEEEGELRQDIEVLLNNDSLDAGSLTKKVKDGDGIHIEMKSGR